MMLVIMMFMIMFLVMVLLAIMALVVVLLVLAWVFGFARMFAFAWVFRLAVLLLVFLAMFLLVALAMLTMVVLVMPFMLGLIARAHGEAALLARGRHIDGTTRGTTAGAQHEAVGSIGHMFPGLDPGLSIGTGALEGSAGGIVKVSSSDIGEDTSVAVAEFMNVTVGRVVLNNEQITMWVTADLVAWLHHASLWLNPAMSDFRAPFGTFSTDESSNSS